MFSGRTASQRAFSFAEEILPEPMWETDYYCLVDVNVASDSEAVIIASDVVGFGGEISSINTATNNKNWTNRVDGLTAYMNIGGIPGPQAMEMYFEIVVTEKLVIVWGTHSQGYYCEGFDRISGQRLIRFSSWR